MTLGQLLAVHADHHRQVGEPRWRRPETARTAMEKGQFYFRKSSQRNDLRTRTTPGELFPVIRAIRIDDQAGTITVHASNYDTIQWISAPESLEPVADYETSNEPWPLGRVVHQGETLNYRDTPNISRYLRIELHRQDGEDLFRTFTNPFGLGTRRVTTQGH
jgi:hypothetical protein